MSDAAHRFSPSRAVPSATQIETAAPDLALFVGLTGGAMAIAFALVTPPFQVPDEPAHFFRAVATSEAHFLSVRRGEVSGQDLPRWAVDSAAASLDSIPGDISRKVRSDWLIQPRASARSIAGRLFVAIPESARVERLGYTASSYSALPYLLPALAVRAGVWSGLSPIAILLLIRLLNAAVALAVTVVAIRLSGPAAPLMALTALLPMAVFLRSSASADGLTLSVALLIIALTLRCSFDDSATRCAALTALAVLSALVCLTKPNLPMALLPLTIPRSRLGRPKAFRYTIVAAVAVGLALASIWGGDAARAAPRMAAAAKDQMSSIGAHPLAFLGILASTWSDYSPRYLEEAIGKFGWLDTYLPGSLVAVAYALLLYASLVWGPRFNPRQRVLYWTFAAMAALLVVITLDLSWNPVGNRVVNGIQGRYFLPILPLFFLPMAGERFRRPLERTSLVALGACQTIILLGSLLVLVRRFYP